MLRHLMELRQLKHFLAVGEAGSITAAARQLRLTQPALSRQMKALEEELDTALLERGAHSITLTPAGEVLVTEARKLIHFSQSMVEKVKATAAGEPLRVGYAPSLAGEFLSIAIERFTQFHPRVRVSLYDYSSAEMRTGLAAGKLDLILAGPCANMSEPIQWIRLRSYGWHVVMHSNNPLGEHAAIQPAQLAGQRLLCFDREHYPDYWDRITRFFRDHNLNAKIAGEFDGVSSLTAALEGNLGIALLATTPMFERGDRQRLTTRPLSVEPDRIEVAAGISGDRQAPPQVLAFIEELKQAASGQ
jgi:LysR family transcriptional regulator, benzoate and cis,cis-muconate-responsive activator of ben and cat genes